MHRMPQAHGPPVWRQTRIFDGAVFHKVSSRLNNQSYSTAGAPTDRTIICTNDLTGHTWDRVFLSPDGLYLYVRTPFVWRTKERPRRSQVWFSRESNPRQPPLSSARRLRARTIHASKIQPTCQVPANTSRRRIS